MQGNVQFNETGSRLSHSVNIYQYQKQGIYIVMYFDNYYHNYSSILLEDGLTLELIGKLQNNTYIAANMSSIWPGQLYVRRHVSAIKHHNCAHKAQRNLNGLSALH